MILILTFDRIVFPTLIVNIEGYFSNLGHPPVLVKLENTNVRRSHTARGLSVVMLERESRLPGRSGGNIPSV